MSVPPPPPPSGPPPGPPPPPTAPRPDGPPPPPAAAASKGRTPVAFLALAVLLASGGTAAFILTRDSAPTVEPSTTPSSSQSASPSPSQSATDTSARGKYGTVASGVFVDGLTVALFEFMDARIARDATRAAESLTADTKQKYDANKGNLNLVSPTSNPHYASYEVLSRESGDASLAGFVVKITEVAGASTSGTFREEIEVGPGTTINGEDVQAAVIDARRVPGCNGNYYDEC